jgi:flagellar basal body-associated protein FliL
MNEEINQSAEKKTKSVKLFFSLVVTVMVLTVAAFYFLGNNKNLENPSSNTSTEQPESKTVPEEDFKTRALEKQGTTDEIDEIQKDLESTDLENLTEEINQIEAEL